MDIKQLGFILTNLNAEVIFRKMSLNKNLSILLLLLLAACSSPQVNPPPGKTPVLPSPELPATSTVEQAQNVFSEGMFTIDLPDGWDIFGPEKVSRDPNPPYDLYLLGENPTTNDGPGISRVVIANAVEWTPEAFVLAQCSTCPVNPFESTTLGGEPGLRTEVGGGGVPIMITWYFIEHNGKLIAFAIHDPETLLPLDDVLNSIQFE